MSVKKHLAGGSLRAVMAAEIKRCLQKYGQGPQPVEHAALELGITPKTLRLWKGPIEKGGWEELQVSASEAMNMLMNATEKMPKMKGEKLKLKKVPKKQVQEGI
jgi:hypothetical protein